MIAKYTLKGINDDVDICEVCGKTGLKRVMWLCQLNSDGNETENIFAAGTSCGANKLGLRLRSVAKIQNKVTEMAIEKIINKISEMRSNRRILVPVDNRLIPRQYKLAVLQSKMTLLDAQLKVKELYPIFNFNQYEATIESINEALKYC